jgi:hypothetical protein
MKKHPKSARNERAQAPKPSEKDWHIEATVEQSPSGRFDHGKYLEVIAIGRGGSVKTFTRAVGYGLRDFLSHVTLVPDVKPLTIRVYRSEGLAGDWRKVGGDLRAVMKKRQEHEPV